MVFLLNTFGKASVPIIDPIPFSSLVVDYASVLRIGLAIFSLLVLLGFGGIDTRSNPYVPLYSSAASDVYKRQILELVSEHPFQIFICSFSCLVVVEKTTYSGVWV